MNKKETSVIENIIQNCKTLDEKTRDKVLWITEGMALAGGNNNGKKNRR